jgi:hypothetical protein
MTATARKYEAGRRRARVSYELARARAGVVRASGLAVLVAVATHFSSGRVEVPWLALTVVVWSIVEWRGGALLRGGRIGAAVGVVALTMPLWAFRSCCRAGDVVMGADGCGMAGACAAIGVGLGLTLAAFLVRVPRSARVESALGMGLALIAVATVRCGQLVAGEALGWIGGLALGALTSGVAVTVLPPLRRAG